MQVSSHSASFLSPKTQEKSALTPRRTKSPQRWLPASYQPAVESRQDDVMFVSGVAFAEVEQRDAFDSSLTSLTEEIEQVSRPRVELKPILRVKGSKGHGASVAHTSLLSSGASAGSDAASDPAVSSNHRSRVIFAENPVTAVKEIPSCLLMTAEEKNCLYRDKRTLQIEGDKFWVECQFEGSQHCCDKAFDEKMFFHNHLGELVHPAHFLPYAREVLPNCGDVVSVPGFASFDAFMGYMMKYAHFYDTAKRNGVFQSQQS